jgi:mucin-19
MRAVRFSQGLLHGLRAFVAAVSLFAVGGVHALPTPPDNTVYANVGTSLYTVNPVSGAAVVVGTLSFSTSGFGRDPITGRVYYAEAALPGRVAYWDPTTGLNTILPTALGFTTNRMGFRADGAMFSMNPGTNNIYVIDKTSGNPTIVATVTGVALNGGGDMAFTPSGDLYIVTASTLYKVAGNPIAVPAVGAIPALSTTAYATGTTGSPTGLSFIDNSVALGTPTTGIVDLNITGGFTNARGANSYSDIGTMPKFADLVISATPSTTNFPRTGSASYSVNVVNNGPQSGSGNFTVTFTLPAGETLVGGGPFGSGWTCVAGPPVVCTNTTTSLVVGASLPTLTVPVTTSVSAGTNSLSTTFVVAGTTFDPATANNTTTVAVGVGAATIAKVFSPAVMAPNGTSTLIFTLSNPTATAMTGVSFTDTFPITPGAMKVAAVPNVSTSGCGTPTFAPAAAAASLTFSAGSIAANGTCTVRVDVTAPTSGTYSNTSSGVVTTQTGAAAGAASNTATLVVMTPAVVSKSFATSPVIPGGPSALTITLTNPSANGANDIIGATFTDVFPTTPGAMSLADAVYSTSCGGTLSDAGGATLAAGSTAVKLVGGTVPAGGACTVKVNVKGPVVGTYNNTTSAVSSANAGTGAVSNTAPLVVQANVAPSIAKNFVPAQIAVGATSVLTFTITNPNPTTALTGVAFTDTFPTSPGAMTVAATPGASTSGCGTPTFAPAANAVSLTFSAGTIPAGGTCTVNVNVTVNAVGAYTNVSNAVSATGPSALTGNTATAVIATLAPPVVAKAFSPATIGTNGTSTVTISISNPNGSQTLTGVAMTDTFPAGLRVAAVPNASVTGCGAPTYAPVAAATSVVFSNGSILGSGLCVIKFDVTSPTNGSYTNTTGVVTTTNGGSGVADSDILTVQATAPASISKAFLTSPMATGVPGVLRFTITNPNTATALAGVAFSDTLPTAPGAMVVAPTPGISTSGCGTPTFAPAAGAAVVSFTAGTIAANSTCTVNVNVVAPVAGSYANTTGTVTSTTPATTGLTAAANVDVLAPAVLSKTFLTNPVAAGVPTTLRFDVSNPNALALTSLVFSDSLPTSPGAMVVAPVPNVTIGTGCGSTSFTPAAGASTINFSTSTIAAGATCRVTVDVVAPLIGTYANTTSTITSGNGGTGALANASLSVIALNAPTLTKTFASAGPISPGVSNALTISIGNSNASAITLSSALVDNLPSGVTVASPSASFGTCVGVTATPGDTKITLANGSSIPSGGCTIVVNVVGNTGGNFTNTLAVGALTTSAGPNAAATSASFSVPFAPVALKSFSPTTVAVGATSQLKITLTNPNASTAITGAAFTDTYPAGLVNTAAANPAISGAGCTGTVVGANGGTSLALSAGSIPAGGSCDITVNVSSAAAASYLNSSGAISTTNVGSGNASSATLAVTVGSPLTVAKSFSVSPIAPNATTQLKIRLTNPNAVAITGAAFTDTYPSGLVNTAAPAGTITGAGCTGSVTATVNGTSLALAVGNIPASSFCDITTNVTSATPGSYANNSGAVTTTNGGTASASSATLVVLSPPTVLKAFSPSAVSVSGTSQLKITITNPNASTALAGVAFSDTYPAGLVNTAAAAGAITGAGCSGTVTATNGGNTLALSAGVVPAGGSCDITVNVSSATAATYNNNSGAVTTTNAGTGAASIGTLSVVSGPAPLTISKVFTPASIGTNDTSVMKITLLNPNAVAVTGAAFTDSYPFSLFNTATPASAISGSVGCAGTVTAAANGASLVLSGGNVPASGSCDITVNVTSAAAGSVVNSTGAVTTTNAGTSTSVNGTLTVLSHMTVAKAFTPSTVAPNVASVLKITLTNPNAVAITGAAFSDAYPSGLVNTATPAGAITGAGCSGTVTATANGTALVLTGGNIPASGSCDITANVKSATAGSYLNNSGSVSSSNAGAGTASSATLTVLAVPTVLKSFAPNSVSTNATSVLKITITNPNASVAMTGVAFSDTYPAGLVNTAAAAGAITGAGCSGTVTATNGGNSLALSAGVVPAASSCDITVNVSSASAAVYNNNSGAITTSNAGTGLASIGTLTVVSGTAPLTVAKVFAPLSIGTGDTSTVQISLTNPNATAVTGVAFNDVYPANLFNTNTPGALISGSVGCAGTVTAVANGTSLALAGGTVPAGGTCEITASVTSAVAASLVNSSGVVSTTNAGNSTAVTGTLTVLSHMTVLKSFTPNSVVAGAASVLKITLTNPNAVAITGASFNDAYPSGLVNTATPAGAIAGAGCAGTVTATANGTALVLTGGSIPASGSCDITANVTSASAGSYANTTGLVSSANAGNGASAGATLTVSAATLPAPTVTKVFTPNTIAAGDVSVLSITIVNPNASAISGAAFTDTYPAGLINTGNAAFSAASVTAGCTGTVTGVAAGTSLSLSGGTLPAGATCVINVNVTSNSAVPTTLTNPAFSVTSANAFAGNAVAANLQVLAKPTISQAYFTSTIVSGGSTTLTFTLSNSNAVALSNANFTDALNNVSVAFNNIGGTCVGVTNSPALAVGTTALNLTVPSLPPGSCTVSFLITGTIPGAWVNTASGITTSQTSVGVASNATSLTVLATPVVGKSFSVNPVAKDATTQVLITVTNNNDIDMTGVAFTDNYPTVAPDAPDNKLVNADSITSASPASCTGTLTAASGTRIFSLTGGTVPANTTCTYRANVKSASTAVPAIYINNSGPVTTTNSGTGASASASLQVINGPTVAKSFSPTSIPVGATSQLTITLATTAGGGGSTAAALTDTYPAGLVNIAGTPLVSNSCGGTVVAASGGNSVSISGGTIPPNSSCNIVVSVTAAVVGSYTNTIAAGALTTSSGSNGLGDSATLVVPARPTINKAFSPASITAGGTTTLTFTLGNINAVPLTNASFTDTLVGMQVANTALGGTCVGSSNTPALTLGATALNLSVPSLPAGGCTVTVQVTSNTVGTWPNTASGVSVSEIAGVGTASNTASLTVTAAGVQLNGFVYSDANHNLQKDSTETGTGLTLYAKLVATASPAGPALQAVVVDPTTGAYVFNGVPVGNYIVLIDNNNSLADVTPTITSTWTGTENADATRRNVAVAGADVQAINFGLFNGNTLSGKVFRDNGSGGGTANNGVPDGSEIGLPNATVRVTNADGSVTYDSSVTAADGSWRVWLAAAQQTASLHLVQDLPTGYRSVSGTAASGYDRATVSLTLAYVAGTNVGGLNFGDVAFETLSASQQQSVVSGAVVFYAHRFVAGSAGLVTFNVSNVAGWSQTLYLDSNCNGVLEAAEPVLSAAQATSAGTPVCVIVKLNVPPGAPTGTQSLLTLQASLAYSGATPALTVLLSNEDLTTVSGGASAGPALALVKSQDTASLLPGGRINYTLTYTNQGSTTITSLRISDFTPAYTRFASATCVGSLPAGVTACTVTVSPAAGASGAVEWLLSGSLLPSASGQVSFAVDLVSAP